jgi:hypothetical protein
VSRERAKYMLTPLMATRLPRNGINFKIHQKAGKKKKKKKHK